MSGTQNLDSDQRTALEMLAENGGEWAKTSGWHVGSAAKTGRLFESLVPTGLVARMTGGRYGLTGPGWAATADHLDSLPVDEF
ncbi:hypothetical protein ACW7N6_38290 [Streptomyces sp. UC1A3]